MSLTRAIVLGCGLVCISHVASASATDTCMSGKSDDDSEDTVSVLQKQQQGKLAGKGELRSLKAACSNHGEDCRQTKCCNHAGMRCFKENEHWASCNMTCDSHQKWDSNSQRWHDAGTHTWDCYELGQWQQQPFCSDHGQDCRETRCCNDPSMRCFKETAHWASCNATCDTHMKWDTGSQRWQKTGDHNWDCKDLTQGSVQGGVPDGANCMESRLCQNPSSQCFVKHGSWATCNATCNTNSRWNDATQRWELGRSNIWNCTVLTPDSVLTPDIPVTIPPPVVNPDCSAHGEDCSETKCCQTAGSKCFMRDDSWASCNATCENKKWFNKGSSKWEWAPMPVWNCTELESSCSGPFEDCSESKCCRTPGSKCFKKDDSWASCNATCDSKKWFNKGSSKWEWSPLPVWDCTELNTAKLD